MKAVVAAFNQEKALVGAFSVITNLRMQCGCNFLKHWCPASSLQPSLVTPLIAATFLHKCGAALLSDTWAITAAHCVER